MSRAAAAAARPAQERLRCVPRRLRSPMLAAVAAGTTPIIPELPIIRARGGGEQRATFFELFFDLVYVFAVTQLSHHLLAELSWAGAAETAFMLVALYWAWNYTTWMTNWFDPDTVPVRLVLVFVMLASLLLAVAIPRDSASTRCCSRAPTRVCRSDVTPLSSRSRRMESSTRTFVRSWPGACSRRRCGSRAASSMPKCCAGFCGSVL